MNATEDQIKPAIINFNDGSLAKVWADGRWDLRLPNGKHLGTEPVKASCTRDTRNAATALEAVRAAHDQYVMAAWERGTFLSFPGKPQHFACPLD